MIISPINNHANRLYSHRTGWGRMWANCLKTKMGFNADWSKESAVYLEHGMEWKEGAKSINYFLASEKQLKKLEEENKERAAEGKPLKESAWHKLAKKAKMFEDFKGELYSLDIDCPMYGTLLKTRVKPWVPDVFKNLDFDKIDGVCKKATTIKQADLKRNYLVLGDSHSLSAWDIDASLCRLDGQTLNGAINRGFDTWIDEFAISTSDKNPSLKTLRVYFGNIDIRHHVCRLNTNGLDQVKATRDLVRRYFHELKRVKDKYGIEKIEVVAAIPIEDESRKLPKTGYHKGKPFWGAWRNRNSVFKNFNTLIEGMCQRLSGYEYITWPNHFKNDKEQLDFQYMERPQSVHISPEHYMWSI